MSCYRLEKYASIRAPNAMKVTTHPCAIKIGKPTRITSIMDNNTIPLSYFNFKPYEELRRRLNNNEFLTGTKKTNGKEPLY
jgi:hypothetical protein